ncbi:MAG: hypothetical protein FJY85_03895 [Deltaproteobacteria bacterium]|nr:hypothetical protein [Deltaproteobacteria bacterium]
MAPTLKALIEQGRQLKAKDLLDGYRAYESWRQECLAFLEHLQMEFQEEVKTPTHIERGLRWLEETFRQD